MYMQTNTSTSLATLTGCLHIGQVWITKPLTFFSICWISIAQLTSLFTGYIVLHSIALISTHSSPSSTDYWILIYSSEHLSSIAFPIHLTGHARPNSSNPKAGGVCAQFPSLPQSVHLPQPFWNGGYESSLHPMVWKAALSQMTIDDNATL